MKRLAFLILILVCISVSGQSNVVLTVQNGRSVKYVESNDNIRYMFSWGTLERFRSPMDTNKVVWSTISDLKVSWQETDGSKHGGSFASVTTAGNPVSREGTNGFTYAAIKDFIGVDTFRAYYVTNSYCTVPDTNNFITVDVTVTPATSKPKAPAYFRMF